MPTARCIPVLAISTEGGPERLVRLSEPVTTIGRSVDNVLEIPDANMSRRHCVLEQRETGEVILTDCNSSNGTKVNGERVISQELRSGDAIECGSSRIRFLATEEDIARQARETRVEESTAPTPSALRRRVTETQLEVPVAHKSEVHVLAHERDDLRKLLEITKELNQVHDLRKLLETIIDAAIELMAAERGFLILLSDGEMRIEIARNMGQTAINDAALKVSTKICRQVIDTGKAVLTTNALADGVFSRYQSVVGLNLRSIICVPFRIKSETLGTVYLDASHAGAFSNRDVALLEAFSDQAALAIDNARLLHAARQRERIEQELRIASQIQRRLLPRELPQVSGIELEGWMHPAKQVGGDYYDFVLSPDKRSLFFCIGDVSGKGVPAGLVMASARSALRSLVQRGVSSTREIVLALNSLLLEDLEREMFLSFVLMRYDCASGEITYTGAGHENILIWRRGQPRVEVRQTGGRVLGVSSWNEEQFLEQRLDLGPGDGIVLYTDGVTEALNEQRVQFDLERLVAATERHAGFSPKQTLHAILGEVLKFKGRASQRDDITLLVVRRTPVGEPEGLVPEEATQLYLRRRP